MDVAAVVAASAGDKPLIGLLLEVREFSTHTHHYMLEVGHYPQLTEVHRLIL